MASSTIASQPQLPAIESRPGHLLLLEEASNGKCSVACSCGGFLEPIPDALAEQVARFRDHISDPEAESTRL